MSKQPEPLAGQRHKGESSRAVLACNDWLRLGPGRSLAALLEKSTETDQDRPPTRSIGTLKEWSTRFDWQARAAIYDAEIELQKNEVAKIRRREAMETGLALDFERVFSLKELFDLIKTEVDENGLYYTDKKISSKGDVVEVELFNRPMIETLRGLLDDLSKETGGRKQKVEHTGKDGAPLQFSEIVVNIKRESVED